MVACQGFKNVVPRLNPLNKGRAYVINSLTKAYSPAEEIVSKLLLLLDLLATLFGNRHADDIGMLCPGQDIRGRFEMIEMMVAAPTRFGVCEIEGKISRHQRQTPGPAFRLVIRPAHAVTS